jgi:enamine deaminase RidA (YjgF/YER057c/UK114 family)
MKIQHLTPDTLFDSRPFGFTQAVVSESRKIVHCAGQTAWTKDMEFVGVGDLAAQADCAFENVRLALAAAGAEPQHVVRLNIYVVNYSPACLEPLTKAIGKFFGPHPPSANTLLGVQSLALPEFLIEIEATAAVD